MKKSIIITCVILAFCCLFLGIYIRDCIIFNSGIVIKNFDKDFENKLLSEFDLENYDYIELTDIYYRGSGIDPEYVVSLKIHKKYVNEFENLYLSTKKLSKQGNFTLVPERDYTFGECKVYDSPMYEPKLNYSVYVKEHTDKNYYEYHIKNSTYGSTNRNVWDLIHIYNTPFLQKNYKVIGNLKLDTN